MTNKLTYQHRKLCSWQFKFTSAGFKAPALAVILKRKKPVMTAFLARRDWCMTMGSPAILILAKTQGARASFHANSRRGLTQRRNGAT